LAIGKLESALDDDVTLGDDFGVLELSLSYLTEDEQLAFDGTLPRGQWWQAGEDRMFVAAPDQEQPMDGWRSSGPKLWLRWATYSNITIATGIESLNAVMAQTGYHSTGDCWALETPDDGRAYRQVFLMPVAKD